MSPDEERAPSGLDDPAAAIQRLIVALGHPLRRQMLRVMEKNGPMGPKGVAKALGVTLNLSSYHVRVAAENGALELVEKRPVGGSVQHFYVFSIDAPWALDVLRAEDEAMAGATS